MRKIGRHAKAMAFAKWSVAKHFRKFVTQVKKKV